MTIEDQLRAVARHADEHQRPITLDEILGRASRPELTFVDAGGGATPGSRRGRRLLVAAAAAVVLVAGALGTVALDDDDDSESLRTVTVPPTPSLQVAGRGLIAFAADARGGDALTDPLDRRSAEVEPAPRDLFVTREGGPVRRLTSTAANERCPSFSPDGGRLAYLELPGADRAGDASVVVVPLDPAGAPEGPAVRTPLPTSLRYGLRTNVDVSCPRWSPDGTRLAYLSPGGSDPTTNEVIELRVWTPGGADKVVTTTRPGLLEGTFAWSPDGEAIAYVAAGGAWVVSLDGAAPSRVLEVDETPVHPDFAGPPRQEATTVSWSSRGDLAVTVSTTTFKDGSRRADGSFTWTADEQTSVHIVDPATRADRILDEVVALDSRVVWSPDGSRFVTTGLDGAVRVLARDGGPAFTLVPRLADGSTESVSGVTWSPDGERLLGLAFTDRGASLVSMPADGSPADVLTPWTWAFDLVTLDDATWQPVPADQ